MSAGVLAACALAALHLAGTTHVVDANGSANSTLFSLTNSDRTSNGVHAVTFSGTLEAIGENARYNCDGITVDGRSYDMIHRNYFAHPILGCGQYVFSMMQAFGIHYKSAGENIGWVDGNLSTGSAASYINGAFMNSPEHRSNILDSRYTEMGVGSDESAPGVVWTGVSAWQTGVWMFSEEFAQVGFLAAASEEDAEARAVRRRAQLARAGHPRRPPGYDRCPPRPQRLSRRQLPSHSPPAASRRTCRLLPWPSTRAFCPTASNPFSKHS